MTPKLQQGSHEVADEWDIQAVPEHAYSSSHTHILQEHQLMHLITYDTISVNCMQEIS